MDTVYRILKKQPGFVKCKGVKGLIEDTFIAIHEEENNPYMSDLYILFYLQQLESVEKTSFKWLKLATPLLGLGQVKQLSKEFSGGKGEVNPFTNNQ